MKNVHFVSNSYEDTLAFGARFAKIFKPGDIVLLFGDLGAGKTAFVKGMAKGLTFNPLKVHSPTFTLMNIYEGRLPLYHFDLYRIKGADLFNMGYEEFFFGKGVTAVEWPERLEQLTPPAFWKVVLAHAGDDKRDICISCKGGALALRLEKIKT